VGLEVDRTGLGSIPVMDVDISCVEASDFVTRVLKVNTFRKF
jgi:uncharacterized membrane-anchored protein